MRGFYDAPPRPRGAFGSGTKNIRKTAEDPAIKANVIAELQKYRDKGDLILGKNALTAVRKVLGCGISVANKVLADYRNDRTLSPFKPGERIVGYYLAGHSNTNAASSPDQDAKAAVPPALSLINLPSGSELSAQEQHRLLRRATLYLEPAAYAKSTDHSVIVSHIDRFLTEFVQAAEKARRADETEDAEELEEDVEILKKWKRRLQRPLYREAYNRLAPFLNTDLYKSAR